MDSGSGKLGIQSKFTIYMVCESSSYDESSLCIDSGEQGIL